MCCCISIFSRFDSRPDASSIVLNVGRREFHEFPCSLASIVFARMENCRLFLPFIFLNSVCACLWCQLFVTGSQKIVRWKESENVVQHNTQQKNWNIYNRAQFIERLTIHAEGRRIIIMSVGFGMRNCQNLTGLDCARCNPRDIFCAKMITVCIVNSVIINYQSSLSSFYWLVLQPVCMLRPRRIIDMNLRKCRSSSDLIATETRSEESSRVWQLRQNSH